MTEPTAAAPAPTDNASMAEDFVDIFVTPSKVFARRAKASPMVPFIVVCVLSIVLFFATKNVLSSVWDAQMQKQMAVQMKANPQLTPEMMEKSKPITNVIINIGGVVAPPILLLIVALITWVIGRFIMGGTFSYGAAVLITAFSWFPRILEGILVIVQGLVMDTSKMTSMFQLQGGVARFFDPDKMSMGLYSALAQIDVFTIWTTVLVIIGLIHAGKLDKSKATATGVLMFLVGALPALWALLSGK
ncbi:MAG: YIP1 family protein [Gemmatimonadales bacterium]